MTYSYRWFFLYCLLLVTPVVFAAEAPEIPEPTIVSDTGEGLTLAMPDFKFPENQTAIQHIKIKGQPTYMVAASPPDDAARVAFDALSPTERQAFLKRRAIIMGFLGSAAHRFGFVPTLMSFAKDRFGKVFAFFKKDKTPSPETVKTQALGYAERSRRQIQNMLNKTNAILWSRPRAIAAADEVGLRVGPVGPNLIIGGGAGIGEKTDGTTSKKYGFSLGIGLGANLGINPKEKYVRFSLFGSSEFLKTIAGFLVMAQARLPIGIYARASADKDITVGSGYYTPAPAVAFLSNEEMDLMVMPELFVGTGIGIFETTRYKMDFIGARIGLGALGTKWMPYIAPEGALWRVLSQPIAAIGRGAVTAVSKVFGKKAATVAENCRKVIGEMASPPVRPQS